MPRLFLIIDGYNLMHASGDARQRYGPGELQLCRHRFLTKLSAALQPDARADCTVVFDAFDPPAVTDRQMATAGLTIHFADPGTDADTLIEDMLQAHSAPRQVMVVSSDHRLHKAARKRRARCLDSDVFWQQLLPSNGPRSRPRNTETQPDPPSTSLVRDQQLEQEFLSLDVDRIADELRDEERRRRKK